MSNRGNTRGQGRGRNNHVVPLGRSRGTGQASQNRGSSEGAFSRGRGTGGRDFGARGIGGRGAGGRGNFSSTAVEVFMCVSKLLKAKESFHANNDRPEPNQSIITDGKVREIEDSIILRLNSKTLTVSKASHFPARPGFITHGKEIVLWANYFKIIAQADKPIHRYRLDVISKHKREPSGKKLKQIINLLIEDSFPETRQSIATDYKSILLSTVPLTDTQNEYEVSYRQEGQDEPGTEIYQLRLQSTGLLSVAELMTFLTSSVGENSFEQKEEIIQALNLIIGQYPKAAVNYRSIGANKHFDIHTSQDETVNLGAGLQAIQGFFFSVRAATARILLNAQVKHGAFYATGPLLGLIQTYIQHNGSNMIRLEQFLKKLRIEVTHIVRKNKAGKLIPRYKTICGLARRNDGAALKYPPKVPALGAGAREVQFHQGDGTDTSSSKGGQKPVGTGPQSIRYITVERFFQSKYAIKATPNIPVVNVGTNQQPSYLPVDVCTVVPGQAYNAKLSPTQTQQMIRFAVRRPNQNAQSIVIRGVQTLGLPEASKERLANFGISIDPRLITVQGRVLNGPAVTYGNRKTVDPRFGSWNLQLPTSQSGDSRSHQFSTKSSLPYWTYLWVSVTGSPDAWSTVTALEETLRTFTLKMKDLGMTVGNHTPGVHVNLSWDGIEQQIDEAIHRFVSHSTRPPPKMLLVILPSVNDIIYGRVKFACDVREGLLNVCVVGSKFAKDRNDQYFANVALKVNLKLGGINHILDKTKLGIIAENKTMIVGMDVTHPSPGSASNAPSVSAMVASIDCWLGQWPAEIRIQKARQEMVADLESMLINRLNLWRKFNKGALPENILIYRDGVSEGQYSIVLDEELPLLRKACQSTYPAVDTKKKLPKISIIVVGKRHNTRFYPTRQADADRSANPPNGTTVDRGITEAQHWDFFLQAHTALQGTARPAHYFVLVDEIFRSSRKTLDSRNASDDLVDLTHHMCYLFGRATKAVSICPPAYYADLVCDRARLYLNKIYSETPAGSVVAESEIEGMVQSEDVVLHENVRNAMFYI